MKRYKGTKAQKHKNTCRIRTLGFVLALLLMFGGRSATADVSTFLIEKALDEPARIELSDVTLGDALARMSKAIGVPFDLDTAEAAFAQLPYGQLSRIESAQLQGIPWRQALAELLKPFALTFEVGQGSIYILGTEDLMRQPQRLNAAELEAMVALQNTSLNDKSDNVMRQLHTASGIEFGLVIHGQRVDEIDRQDGRRVLSTQPAPASDVLTRYSRMRFRRGEPSVWYLVGGPTADNKVQMDIRVVSPSELMGMKLQRRVNLQFQNRPVQDILLDLAAQAAVNIYFEPGCIGMVDPGLRDNFNMVGSASTIERALEAISGMTGLTYYLDSDGLHIAAGDNLRNKSMAPGSNGGSGSISVSNPTVCVLTVKIPGTDIETRVLIRENDLREAGVKAQYEQVIQKNLQEFFQNLRALPISSEPQP